MKLRYNINAFYFFALFLIALSIGVLAEFILPERFFYDTKSIAKDIYNEIGWVGSYPFSISFYHYLHLSKLPFFIIALIQIPILFYLMIKIGIPYNFFKINLKNSVVYVSLILIGVFINMPSKEFISFFVYFYFSFNFNKIKTKTDI